jgi:aminoglycoside phosphotransferase (APT) family kinase protein
MHPDQADIGLPLVTRLIAAQFPRWKELPLAEVRSAGTDNRVYRMGTGLAVRLPRRQAVATEVDRLRQWLPRLAPHLPLAVPMPVARGAPGEGFPFPWLVCQWLDGQDVTRDLDVDLADAAVRLGRFVAALHRIDATGAPNSPLRGGPLDMLDERVRREIGDLGADGTIDPQLVTAAWDRALDTPAWNGAPTWVHADLYPGNLVARQHRLEAVIDFGGLGTGDPAIDLLPAWAWLSTSARSLFRAQAEPDDATWARGRGWALGLALGAVCFYRDTNPALAAAGQRTIAEALAELPGQLNGARTRRCDQMYFGRIPEAVSDARRALEVARQAAYPAGEVLALAQLSRTAHYAGDTAAALDWVRQAQRILAGGELGWTMRFTGPFTIEVLMDSGDLAVRSHLDRIRDKTGYRRRADLTRFALEAALV